MLGKPRPTQIEDEVFENMPPRMNPMSPYTIHAQLIYGQRPPKSC
jgi:hypothetical protein